MNLLLLESEVDEGRFAFLVSCWFLRLVVPRSFYAERRVSALWHVHQVRENGVLTFCVRYPVTFSESDPILLDICLTKIVPSRTGAWLGEGQLGVIFFERIRGDFPAYCVNRPYATLRVWGGCFSPTQSTQFGSGEKHSRLFWLGQR